MIGSTTELISNALEESDEGLYWNIIGELHRRGSAIEFDVAKALSGDLDSSKRMLAADILGQLGQSQQTFQSESVSILISLLADSDENVLYSAACALGHRNDIAAVPFLVALISHYDSDIRLGVTFGLSGVEDEEAIKGLIKLSRDSNSDVRDWATFGLGSQCEFDSEDLRAALIDRLSDDDADARAEAMIGLAQRSDPRAFKAIFNELKSEFVGSLVIRAAGVTKSPRFVPLLKKLRLQFLGNAYFLSEIDEAIDSCSLKVVKP